MSRFLGEKDGFRIRLAERVYTKVGFHREAVQQDSILMAMSDVEWQSWRNMKNEP